MNTDIKLLCLDCDSTLSEIEGVDELAAVKGAEVKQQIIDLTNMAMSGEIAIEEIFGKRLDLIQPTKQLCQEVGKQYIEKISKGAKESLIKLKQEGWTPIIISGGFEDVIAPFAEHLSIDEVYAVPLQFNPDGSYLGYTASPTTRNGGKPEIIEQLKIKYRPDKIIMVGDGVSDLECASNVDLFIGYGEYEAREKVVSESKHFAYNFDQLEQIINNFSCLDIESSLSLSTQPTIMSKGKRYTQEEKQEVIDFVNQWNADHKGRGGVANAHKKFGITALTIKAWVEKANPSTGSKKAASGKKIGNVYIQLGELAQEIEAKETELGNLQKKFATLKKKAGL